MNHKKIILHLSLIDGAGPAVLKRIVENTNFNLEEIYNLSSNDFQRIFNLSEIVSNKIEKGLEDKDVLDREFLLIEKNKINWSTMWDDDYPELLKNIHLPPSVIYWLGKNLENQDKRIAIIGSRKATSYSKKTIDTLVRPLVLNDWSIVSGGAIGADTMAHESALNNNGKTIAILGSGILNLYPPSNKKLFNKILENNGTILSSFPLQFPVLPQNFPARNRIISGLSKGCIVVQASMKSGTRITALHALEQGRDVFAVPGPIDDDLSSGCNKLIQEGAKLVTCANDILEEYGECSKANEQKIKINIEKNNSNSLDFKIIDMCSLPISIEELSQHLSIEISELQFKLFELQLDGSIQQNFAGLWQKLK